MANPVKINDRVIVQPSGAIGTVKFMGPTKFAKGRWIGIQLDKPEGKNDGSVAGIKYFACPDNYGLFCRQENVVRLKADSVLNASPAGNRRSSGAGLLSPRGAPMSPAGRPLGRSDSMKSVEDPLASLVLGTAHEDLFDAAKDYENMNFLKILVEEDGVPVTGTDQFGNTALHIVANQGGGAKCIAVLKYLLEKGLDPYLHARNLHGQTAVMMAALNKRWEVVEYLVSIGADTISKGTNDLLPSVWDCCLNIAVGEQALHVGMDKFRKHREENKLPNLPPPMRHKQSTLLQALFKAAHAGDIKYVRMLLEDRDVNVNSIDSDGNTVLHWIASDPKRLPVLKYLVAMGGRIHIKNKIGDTCCLVAARSRAWPVMQYLVSIGASISVKDEKTGKSVFKHAQANLISRKALADGLAEKKRTNVQDNHADEQGVEVKDDEYEREQYELEAERRAAERAEEEKNEQWQTTSMMSDVEAYRNQQEVLDDLKAQQPAPPSAGATAGTFSGVIVGKKKDSSKGKQCKVLVGSNSILIQYKKGGFFSRKDATDEYKWSDTMSLRKTGPDSLQVVLEHTPAEVVLTISPCQPDVLEEFMWKHIWLNVFEASFQEAQQLFDQYENFCNQTAVNLKEKNAMRSMAQNDLSNLKVKGAADEQKKRLITERVEQINKEIRAYLTRFPESVNKTLLDTFDKMYEALDRRYLVEEKRKKDFTAKEMYHKAQDVKADQDSIKAQMDRVANDRQKVQDLYESMKSLQLQFGDMAGNE